MKSSSSLRRVGFSFGAQIYNQAVNIGVQILLVPVLLHAWSAQRYGVWVLLSAIPIYLTFSDFGFCQSAKNEMTIRAAKNDLHGALVTYQSVFMLLNVAAATMTVLIAALIMGVRLGSLFDLGDLPESHAKLIIFLLGLNAISYQYLGLIMGGVRATGRPAAEIALTATSRLFGGLVTGGVALLGGDLTLVAALTLLQSLFFGVVTLVWLRAIAPWLKLGWANAARREIDRLFHPSISFMSQAIGNSVAISGPIVVLGMVMNPLSVVIFSTTRTMVRLGTTASNTVGAAMMPEYSRLFGQGNVTLLKRLAVFHLLLTIIMAVVFWIVLYLIGDWLIVFWTDGHVHLEQPLFSLLMLWVVFEMLWTTLFIPIAAINRHVFIAHAFGVLSLSGVISGYFLAERFGFAGVALPMVLVNAAMVVIAAVQVIKQAPDSVHASALAALKLAVWRRR